MLRQILPVTLASYLATRQLRAGLDGHLGVFGERCIAIDHDGRYFYGEHSHLWATGQCFFAPGVAVVGFLPAAAMESPAVRRRSSLAALAALAQLRHPWFRALLMLLGGASVTLLIALLRL